MVVGGLAGRLLQVFLDLPGAALLTRIRTARDQLDEADRTADSDAARMRQLVADQRAEAERQLATARAELAGLTAPAGTSSLVAEVSSLTGAAVTAEAALREARETFELLRWQRRFDEKRLIDLREHEAARLFFHALDPHVCPRCEAPISPARRAAERDNGICAVCTVPTPREVADPAEAKAAEQEAQWRFTASREAEELAKRHRDDHTAYAGERRRALAEAERALVAAQAGESEDQRRALVNRVARLEGAVAAWESLPPAGRRPRDDARRCSTRRSTH